MNNSDILQIFKKAGGYITNSHIVYTSGRHGETYLNKDAIYPHTQEVSKICEEIANRFKDKNIEVVAAPALGGIILSQWTAHHLTNLLGSDVLGVYTEKTMDKQQIFTRDYDKLVKGKKILVVEDITTTGGSVRKVVESVKGAGGEVVAVCVLVNRDPQKVTEEVIGAPFFSLATVEFQSWEEKDCELCKTGIPINTTVGKGREFLQKLKK